MEAIGLVMNDDFLLHYNITIPTKNIMKYIFELNPRMRTKEQASFDKIYAINFTKVITQWGYCNTFNILDAAKLINLNE